VPTWFFGDGASLLNDALTQLGIPSQETPLDAALASPGFSPGTSGAFGLRVRRHLSRRFDAEVSLDFLTGSPGLSNAFLSAVETTRSTFQTAMSALLASGPFANPQVTATSSASAGAGHELSLTGALQWHLRSLARFQPYVTLGGGLLSGAGSGPSVTLAGDYHATLPNGAPTHETDTLVVQYSRATRGSVLAGAGLARDLTNRIGLRLDARVLFGPNTIQTTASSSPTVVTATPAGFTETLTAPSIQFSNNSSTGRTSSLGAPGLQNAVVFSGSGWQLRTLVTVGVFVRF